MNAKNTVKHTHTYGPTHISWHQSASTLNWKHHFDVAIRLPHSTLLRGSGQVVGLLVDWAAVVKEGLDRSLRWPCFGEGFAQIKTLLQKMLCACRVASAVSLVSAPSGASFAHNTLTIDPVPTASRSHHHSAITVQPQHSLGDFALKLALNIVSTGAQVSRAGGLGLLRYSVSRLQRGAIAIKYVLVVCKDRVFGKDQRAD